MDTSLTLEHPRSERTAALVGTVALVLLMAAFQAFKGDDDHAWRMYLIISAIGIVGALVVYLAILPRIAPSGRSALILAVLAAASIVVFWLDLLPSLAGAAILTALAVRRAGRSRAADGAIGLSVLALAAYVVVSIVG